MADWMLTEEEAMELEGDWDSVLSPPVLGQVRKLLEWLLSNSHQWKDWSKGKEMKQLLIPMEKWQELLQEAGVE